MGNEYKLKDFQEETVKHILDLFKKRQRVLLADEVGLGKTIVAREVINRMAKKYKGDDKFIVIYVCSNINIANQNCEKLGVKQLHNDKEGDKTKKANYSESRLSMQHLKIAEQQSFGRKSNNNDVLILPMTPVTSFSMKSRKGTIDERALIFLILQRNNKFKQYISKIERILKDEKRTRVWKDTKKKYIDRIKAVKKHNKKYVDNVNEVINNILDNENETSDKIFNVLKRKGKIDKESSNEFVKELRKLFAKASIKDLNPSLVIMDEFQRFKDLLNDDNENKILIDSLLENKNTKVLLLSATPYKLYSTLEELSESNGETDHFKEFNQVFDFLQKKEKQNLKDEFKEKWKTFSDNFTYYCFNDNLSNNNDLVKSKNDAQEVLYNYMSRTERIGNIAKTSSTPNASIPKADILTYIEVEKLLNKLNLEDFNIDYIKSTPYPFSYMSTSNYKICEKVKEALNNNNFNLKKETVDNLFIDIDKIRKYEKVYDNNYRLKYLVDSVFGDENSTKDKYGPEFLLWIPASKPYYKTNDGLFDNNKLFSKVLVFSSWAMVPKMIASMTSYEAERRVVNSGNLKIDYFKKNNLIIRENGNNGEETDPYKLLTYVSKFLSKCYNPLDYIDENITIDALVKKVAQVIEENIKSKFNVDEQDSRSNKSISAKDILKVLDIIDTNKRRNLKLKKEIYKMLALLSIGAPAICAYRLFNDVEKARVLSYEFISLFNKGESQNVLKVLYPSLDYYWEKIIRYCVSGNLQAVIDEYAYILKDSEDLLTKMIEGFGTGSSISVEIKSSFLKNIDEDRVSLKCNFGVGFYDTRVDDKTINRTNNIRNYFNSPFRPFVLATTSIGQEGLDFHNYCRKIVHWNLPHNPVDFEQREGRINRYFNYAIRQNLAMDENINEEVLKRIKNTKSIKGKEPILFLKELIGSNKKISILYWKKLEEVASEKLKGNNSDLVPFWCLPDKYKCNVNIERFVPIYPFSMDQIKYSKLMSVLKLYRLTLGQARQEDLVESIKEKNLSEENMKEMYIDLSPWNYKVQKNSM